MLDASVLESLTVLHEQTLNVKSLQDFHSGHRVPDEVNDRTKAFVGKCGHQDISNELDQQFAAFRKNLGLKRVDLKVSDPDNGMGVIETPWFDYQVLVLQSEETANEAVMVRQIVSIKETEILSHEGFNRVFANQFNCVEFAPPEPVDIEAFIDHVEDQEFPQVKIDYDRTATWCTLTAPGIPGEVGLEGNTIRLTMTQLQSPLDLINAFLALQSELGFPTPNGDEDLDSDTPSD